MPACPRVGGEPRQWSATTSFPSRSVWRYRGPFVGAPTTIKLMMRQEHSCRSRSRRSAACSLQSPAHSIVGARRIGVASVDVSTQTTFLSSSVQIVSLEAKRSSHTLSRTRRHGEAQYVRCNPAQVLSLVGARRLGVASVDVSKHFVVTFPSILSSRFRMFTHTTLLPSYVSLEAKRSSRTLSRTRRLSMTLAWLPSNRSCQCRFTEAL